MAVYGVSRMKEWEDMTFPERLVLKDASERSFLNFTRIFFELLQGEKLMVNWHHRLIAEEIDLVVRGGKSHQSLAICMPPGSTKTEFLSIHLPAYTNMLVSIGFINKFRNLNLSSGKSLVERNSRRTKDIIGSQEYQEFWPCSFGVNQAEEWNIVDQRNKVKGQTVSKPMGGQIIGSRGGFPGDGFSGALSLDDPDKADDMFSEVKRDRSKRILTNTVRSRRGDKSKDNPTPVFIIQQRLHVEDSVGYALSGGMGIKFKEIKIPALITKDFLDTLDEDTRSDCWNSIKDSDSRIINGVEHWSYWPEMEHIDQLIDLWERDEYTFLSQYMQAPKMLSGGLIETDWFQTYTQLPFLEYASIYVDTNSGKVKDHNDYTVFTLCGMGVDGNMYVLDSCRGKWDPTDLLETAESLWKRWTDTPYSQRLTVRYMSIEDKQAGQGLITTLQKRNSIPVNSVQRGQDQNKLIRHNNCQPQMKMGKVFIPALHDDEGNKIFNTTYESGEVAHSTEWVQPFLAELAGITVGVLTDKEKGFDDQYDTLMDAIDDMLIHNHSAGLASWIG